MHSKAKLAFFILLMLAVAGCAKKMVINVDGMPISTNEYNLTNDETGIRVVFILARYYKDYEGEEYILKPEYLDALESHRVSPEDTERLVLHIKVINLKKSFYSLNWEINEPDESKAGGVLYAGKLSRKDYYLKLPVSKPGAYSYSFELTNADREGLFSLPRMGYKVKGGANTLSNR